MPAPKVLAGRYELGEMLGRGGMATVYSAKDRVLERSVAVKILASQFAGDEQFVERFRREARSSAGLNHPNVVSVFDTGSDDGTHFIVMEQVRGRTLADLLADRGAIPPERAAAIAATIARALDSAHEQDLVHRDVKPGNVLLTEQGEVKVTDFGIARAATGTSITETGAVLGTASYLSPEQAQGGVVDARSDIYSLGCVLYEMLTGRPPFSGDSAVAVATQHVSDEPPPASSVREGVPAELEAVALRAMAKDPDERFATAGEMAAALDRAVGGEVTQGMPVVGAGEPTKVIRPTERTAVLPAASPSPLRPERAWWLWGLGILGLVILGFILIRTLLGGAPAGVVEPTLPAPVMTTPAPVTVVELPTVEEAHAELIETISQAGAEGALTSEVGDELLSRIDSSVEHYQAGEDESAFGELAQARDLVAAAALEGLIAEPWDAQITGGIATLRTAMEAAPVEPKEEGKGNDKGEGKGEGKGKDKEGEGDD